MSERMSLDSLEVELEVLEVQLQSEIENPRMSIDGFLSLMRERDRVRELRNEAARTPKGDNARD